MTSPLSNLAGKRCSLKSLERLRVCAIGPPCRVEGVDRQLRIALEISRMHDLAQRSRASLWHPTLPLKTLSCCGCALRDHTLECKYPTADSTPNPDKETPTA